MAVTKKRKHGLVEQQPSAHAASQPDIRAFASVRKSQHSDSSSKKRKTTQQPDVALPSPAPLPTKTDQKRKRVIETTDENDSDDNTRQAQSASAVNNTLASSPRRKRTKNVHAEGLVETPSKSAMAMFNKLKLDPNVDAIPFKLNARMPVYNTPPESPEAEHSSIQMWPTELEDLVRLNSAFLSALSLYYAHNGTTSPVNIKALLPIITKHWKQRNVSLDDLRLLFGVDQGQGSNFELKDFGRAGICIIKLQPRGRATKRASSYIDESDLNSQFEDALKKKWNTWLASTPKENQDVTVFLDQLKLVEIIQDDSVDKAAPLFARGHQRLTALKASQAAASAETVHPAKLVAEQNTTSSIQSRGTNLLDRILAKQAHSASLSAGPTKDQLERRAALQRVEDIARILDLLTAGRPRCSFSMQAMTQQLQQSLRNPISKEEVQRCLDIMAKEITPGFVSLVKSGVVKGVVVTRGGKVGLEELRRRVEVALA